MNLLLRFEDKAYRCNKTCCENSIKFRLRTWMTDYHRKWMWILVCVRDSTYTGEETNNNKRIYDTRCIALSSCKQSEAVNGMYGLKLKRKVLIV